MEIKLQDPVEDDKGLGEIHVIKSVNASNRVVLTRLDDAITRHSQKI